ncbi:hypothetical protein KRR39_10020 [Nocardioides panacis]|uniref:Allene oxide cyclase n=1 Tax=Nocardioides panacis TaxID=2849501 RepID=A0A975T1X4_9ACTN|nr:hypothetical protein [Nocardioides panacis]QWZ10031.1 hypothetical protein KRR39_10020 [Nocardioides panacis]
MTTSRARALVLTAALTGVMLGLPASSATGQSAAAAGHQRFLVISTDPSEEGGGTVAGFGPIHAQGTDVAINAHRDRFEFPAGNVVVRHHAAKGSTHESHDPKTCYFRFRERGTWTAVSGTGAYAKVDGRGTYRVQGHGFGCDQHQPPKVFSLVIRARGHLGY